MEKDLHINLKGSCLYYTVHTWDVGLLRIILCETWEMLNVTGLSLFSPNANPFTFTHLFPETIYEDTQTSELNTRTAGFHLCTFAFCF